MANGDLEEDIERLVDDRSLAAVLDALVQVCRARSEASAVGNNAMWSLAAGRIERLLIVIERLGL